MYKHLIGALAALALVGCGEEFPPASRIDGLRLLAIRAEEPELVPPAPGEPPARTALNALVADPAQLDDPSRRVSVLYIGCTPSPGRVEAGICTALENLITPNRIGGILAAGGCFEGAPGHGDGGGETVRLVGFEACTQTEGCGPAEVEIGGVTTTLPEPVYEVPGEFRLDSLPPGHPQRTNGVQAAIVAVAVAATPQELVEGADPSDACRFSTGVGQNLSRLLEERERMTALKRVQLRGPDVSDPINVNPILPGITANGQRLDAPTARVGTGARVDFLPVLPTDEQGQPIEPQAFTRYDSEGKFLRVETESWLWSWYATGGEFEDLRTRTAEKAAQWTSPKGTKKDPIPGHRRVFVYSVMRDARGGIDWVVKEIQLDP